MDGFSLAFESLSGDDKFIKSLISDENTSLRLILTNDESIEALVLLARSSDYPSITNKIDFPPFVIVPVRNGVIELLNGDLVIGENMFRELANEIMGELEIFHRQRMKERWHEINHKMQNQGTQK